MKIDHFAYEVSNLDVSIRFYVEKLGFKVAWKKTVDEKEHEAFAVLENEGGRLELIQALSEANGSQPFEPVRLRPHCCPHLAVHVDDFEAALTRLKQDGIPLVHGPLEVPGVAKWVYFCDPDGNAIELCHYPVAEIPASH